jgi:phage FluMu gp28-like protein
MDSLLLPYQQEWLADKSALKICEKGRRTGISWAESAAFALEAAKEGGRSTFYLSYNRDMTKQFISDCAEWAKSYEAAASAAEEVVIEDDGKDILTYRVRFASGAQVLGLPGTPHSVRSKQGRVVIDEAAFVDDLPGMLKAAKALVMWGGQVSLISTHNGDANPFAALLDGIRAGREAGWPLHRVPFSEAVRQGLYKKICVKNGREWSAGAERDWVAWVRDVYRDNADEELEAAPSQAGSRYFSRAPLDRASREIPLPRLSLADDFLWMGADKKRGEIERWFSYYIEPHLASFSGRAYAGMDFARSGDLSLLWFLEETGRNEAETRLVAEIKNCPFEQQKQLVFLIGRWCRARGVWGGIALDARGNGQNLAEEAVLEFPGSAAAVMETPAWYAEWFPRLRAMLDEGTFFVPDDEAVKSDFSVVQLKNDVPHIPPLRTADRDGKGKRHGDGAAGAALALYAWSELAADPPPVACGTGRSLRAEFRGY